MLRSELVQIQEEVAKLKVEIKEKERAFTQLKRDAAHTQSVLRNQEAVVVRKLSDELHAKEVVVQDKTKELQALQSEMERWFRQYRDTQPVDRAPVNFAALRSLSETVIEAESQESKYRTASWSILVHGAALKESLRCQTMECDAAHRANDVLLLRHLQQQHDVLAHHVTAWLSHKRHQRDAARDSANHLWDAVLFYARSVTHPEDPPQPPPKYYAVGGANSPSAKAHPTPRELVESPTVASVMAQRNAITTASHRPMSAPQRKADSESYFAVKMRQAICNKPPANNPAAAGVAPSRPRTAAAARKFNPSSLRNKEQQQRREELLRLMNADREQMYQERAEQIRAVYQSKDIARMCPQDMSCGIYKYRIYGRHEKEPVAQKQAPPAPRDVLPSPV